MTWRIVAVGAGRMGRGIATAFAYAGHRVALIDLKARPAEDAARLQEEAIAEIRANLESLARLGALAPAQVDRIVARVAFVDEAQADAALGAAELVFEGVPETRAAKQYAFERLGRSCRDDTILASTTSSILVTQLAALVRLPGRFLSVHWLNPAYLIPVVEMSTHPGTDPVVLERAKALLTSIGKLPVVCGPAPGYIVPRLQALIMNEAVRMIEEGIASAEEIDKATRFGLGLRFAALGVAEFVDYGGADILFHASGELAQSVDARRYDAPAMLEKMMAAGELGLGTGKGLYDYADRDIAAYRRDVLSRTLAMVRHAGLWRAASDTTLP